MKRFCLILLSVFLIASGGFAQTAKNLFTTTSFVEKSIILPNKVKLEYVEQGKASGIPVILLHGFTDSWHSYELVLPYLPESLHTFVLSQRGHGNSDRPATGYNPKDFSADVAGFITQLNLGPCIIVGHSLGATIAQSFAIDYPELTMALVLVGSFATYANKPEIVEFKNVVAQLKDPVDINFVKEFQRSTLYRTIPEKFFNTAVQESLKLPVFVWQSVINELMKVDYLDELRKINKTTLIVWGDKDLYCSNADQEALATAIRGSQLLVYTGTGHAVHWEQPEKFAGDLVTFIKKSFHESSRVNFYKLYDAVTSKVMTVKKLLAFDNEGAIGDAEARWFCPYFGRGTKL